MKNIEKYHKTKCALDAYNNSVKNVPFDEWLELEYKEPHERTLLEAAKLVANEYYICGTPTEKSLRILGESVDRELKKPVLNCDKYRTAKDAFAGFNKMCSDKSCDRCPFSAERNECCICKLNWLFAEAASSTARAVRARRRPRNER